MGKLRNETTDNEYVNRIKRIESIQYFFPLPDKSLDLSGQFFLTNYTQSLDYFLAVQDGFEPSLTPSKGGVLPLHY